MKIIPIQDGVDSVSGGCKILFFTVETVHSFIKKNNKDHDLVIGVLREKIFTGEKGKISVIYGTHPDEITLLAGLGEEKHLSLSLIRKIAAVAAREAKKQKKKQICLQAIPPSGSLIRTDESKLIQALLEGFILATYEFSKYSTEKQSLPFDLILCNVKKNYSSLIEKTKILCEGVFFARNWVNENASLKTPARLASEAKKIALENKLSCTVLDEKSLQKSGCHLLCAVGQGAVHPPRLVFIEYRGAPSSKKKIALVGKGITFDSGGLNLKTSGHIEDMKLDMAGAAAVLGTLKALSRLKIRINVIGVMACAENAIGSRSYKPGDIVKAFNGKYVEVLNTDAEGRLILADALSYTEKYYKPDMMIDLATLTGAVIVCLGHHYAALLTKDKKLEEIIIQSAEETDEKVWPLPLTEPYSEEMKSDIADIKNISKNKNAGTITGAVFLSHFVEKTRWAHVDIAGTAWSPDEHDLIPKYATGFGVRLLTDLCSRLAKQF
ncbi:MAG: leucyl aminopeptidase family protein [Candidatus Aureabacteria bacterium]|nr:leucyl aminopeptidase family protein [Candidatus Auribacterota bacterium]